MLLGGINGVIDGDADGDIAGNLLGRVDGEIDGNSEGDEEGESDIYNVGDMVGKSHSFSVSIIVQRYGVSTHLLHFFHAVHFVV